jgi:hypothetical protein
MESTIVYKKGGPHRGPYRTTYSYKGVSDEKVLKQLLKDGWYEDLDEAVNPAEEIRRKEKGDKLILGRSKVNRKEDFEEKPEPKTKPKAKPKSAKQQTKDKVEAIKEEASKE